VTRKTKYDASTKTPELKKTPAATTPTPEITTEVKATPNLDERQDPQETLRDRVIPDSKTTCLIVHYSFHADFDTTRFSSKYETKRLRRNLVSSILKNGNVTSSVTNIKPDMVFIHTGILDLWNGRLTEDVLNDFKQIIWNVLEETKAKICISLLIPCTDHKKLNERIKQLNQGLSAFVYGLRKQLSYRSRVFTTNNDKLTNFITKTVGPNGECLVLSEHGEKILWLKLRDSIARVTEPWTTRTPENTGAESRTPNQLSRNRTNYE